MGVGRVGSSPWIFIYGTIIVHRGLNVVFFGLFSVGPPWKRLNSAIFDLFSVGLPLEIFLPTRLLLPNPL